MNADSHLRLFTLGGLSGIVGTAAYVVAATVSLPPVVTYVVAMSWPILSIVFIFSLYRFLELDHAGISNQLALLFGSLAFTLVAAMISVQLAVNMGIDEYLVKYSKDQQPLLDMVRRSIRLVDMGLDVAWDLFGGMALVFLSFALGGSRHFGRWWGIPLFLLSAAVIVLNISTFPWPPDSRGLFDVGPAIGLFLIVLSIRLLVLARRIGRGKELPVMA